MLKHFFRLGSPCARVCLIFPESKIGYLYTLMNKSGALSSILTWEGVYTTFLVLRTKGVDYRTYVWWHTDTPGGTPMSQRCVSVSPLNRINVLSNVCFNRRNILSNVCSNRRNILSNVCSNRRNILSNVCSNRRNILSNVGLRGKVWGRRFIESIIECDSLTQQVRQGEAQVRHPLNTDRERFYRMADSLTHWLTYKWVSQQKDAHARY